MILRVAALLFLILTATLGSRAVACSCAPPQGAEVSVRAANAVVLAEVVSSEQHRNATDTIVENVVFRVIETFKGTPAPGSLLRTQSTLGPAGPCGISVKNSPVWLESTEEGKQVPTQLGGRWVIYVPDRQPFELSMCGPSVPVEAGGSGVLRELRALKATPHSTPKPMTKPQSGFIPPGSMRSATDSSRECS